MSQSQSTKASSTVQKDGASRYLEALVHVEQLLEAQPAEEDKSAWRRWARELIDYEVKTLTPREKRAPRLVKYSDGAGERFLAVMKAIEVTDARLKNGDGGPSSSGESEPEEPSTPRRSKRQLVEAIVPAVQAVETEMRRRSNDSPKITATAPNMIDVQRTVNYEVPCARCARAGIACAGKEGRACFTCRAHRQGCELSSRALRERARTDGSDKEGEEQGSVSTAAGPRSVRSKGKEKLDVPKDGKKKTVESESAVEARGSRPRRAATLVGNWRAGSPKTIAQLRAGSPDSILRKRRATDADLSVASSAPPGPSPLKKAKASTRREDGQPSSAERDVDREEVRDALLVCEAAFRQLRKALRV